MKTLVLKYNNTNIFKNCIFTLIAILIFACISINLDKDRH